MRALRNTLVTAGEVAAAPPDEEVVRRILAGEAWLFEVLMRRHNQRLFRMLRAMVRSDAEAEDVMQEAYVRAFAGLAGFAGRASFSTWLLRIAAYEAMARTRRGRRFVARAGDSEEAEMGELEVAAPGPTPEDHASAAELRVVLAEAIDALPQSHRAVFVLREVEGLSTAETAEALGLSEENVKVRLHRARGALRSDVDRRIGGEIRKVWLFDGARCDRVVAAVLARLEAEGVPLQSA